MRKPNISVIRESISKLVALLTDRNIKVTQRGTSAYVSYSMTGKITGMNIPYLHDDADPDFVAAVQGFVDHEVGHVLFTDPASLRAAARKGSQVSSMHNIVEDVFIERSMEEKFWGSSKNLDAVRKFHAYKAADTAIVKALKEGDTVTAQAYLVVLVCRAWGGQSVAAGYIDENPQYKLIANEIEKKLGVENLKKLKGLKSSDECLKLAIAMLDSMRQQEQTAQPKPEPKQEQKPEPEQKQKPEPEPEQEPEQAPEQEPEPGEDAEPEQEQTNSEEDADSEEPGNSCNEEEQSELTNNPAEPDEETDPEPQTEPDEETEPESEQSGQPESESDPEPEPQTEPGEDPAPELGASELPNDADEEQSDESEKESQSGQQSNGEPDQDEESDGLSAPESEEGDTGEGSNQSDDGEVPEMPNQGSDQDEEQENNQPTEQRSDEEVEAGIEELLSKIQDFDTVVSAGLGKVAREHSCENPIGVFSTEFDLVEKYEGQADEYRTKQMVDRVQQMVSPMAMTLKRALAAKDRVTYSSGQRKGRINPGALYRTSTGDDRVFRTRYETKAPNTAVTLMIDCSGSMQWGGKIVSAAYAALALSMTLERLKIKNEVIGFTTTKRNRPSMLNALKKEPAGSYYPRDMPIYMPIFKGFDERMGHEQQARLAHITRDENQGWLHTNVDGESLRAAVTRNERLAKAERRIVIVLSDGKPNCSYHGDKSKILEVHDKYGAYPLEVDLARAVQETEERGVEVIGIGIADKSVSTFYPKSVYLPSVSELPTTVMSELTKLLLA